MKRKTLYTAVVVLASCWLGVEALIRAQGGPGSGAGPGSPSTGETPDVPGSGPASPIDQPTPNAPGQAVQRSTPAAGRSAVLDASAADRVRSSILNDPALLTFNQKVSVSFEKGKVQLRGQVGTHQERDLIFQRAAQIVGSGNVDNRLSVSDQIR